MHRAKALSLTIFFASSFGIATRANDQTPADFRVTIHDYPGLSDWKPFETTIMADGTVLQTVFDKEHPREKRFKIAQQKIIVLFDEIRRADFFSLPREYTTEATDCAKFVISVTANGKSHEVTFPTCDRREASAKRFLRIWAAALRAFPSPNPEQKPEVYAK
jgi:hypothetical protein